MPARDGSIRYVTNSELQTFKACRRKWWLAYWRKLTPVKEDRTGARGVGTHIHLALAERYKPGGTEAEAHQMLANSYAADLSMYEEQQRLDEIPQLQKDQELATIMLEGYFEWVAEEGADIGLDIYATEAEVSAPVGLTDVLSGAPIELLGRLDVRVRRETDGARLFLDHKNVGSFSQATQTLHMDEQMLMYHLLEMLDQTARGIAPEDQVRCDGGIYNMLRRVKRTASAKPPFYAREEIHHNLTELRGFYVRVMNTIRDIMLLEQDLATSPEDQHHLIAYPRPSRDCTWSCDFYAACHLFDDGSHVEGLLSSAYTSYDPLARYTEQESGLEGESA